MKIINKKEFFILPVGTLFCDYQPYSFGNLKIKHETIDGEFGSSDYYEQNLTGNIEADSSDEFFSLLDEAVKAKRALTLDFNVSSKEGMFEPTQLYAVYEQKDIDALIKTLKTCKGLV